MKARLRGCGVVGVFAAALAGGGACGGGEAGDGATDQDSDGLSPDDGDCDDANAQTHPDAVEACDGIDNDCNGVVDDGYDADGDSHTTCAGDCRDNDPDSYPGAFEEMDGVDNDCDRKVDNHSNTFDDDGDGFSEEQGDCNDDEANNGALVGPAAIEVAVDADGEPQGVDDDCDGMIDEALEPCPEAALDATVPANYALALDVCHEVVSTSWADDIALDERSHAIATGFGDVYVPHAGSTFAVLSTGLAVDRTGADWIHPYGGTTFPGVVPHPDPGPETTCEGLTFEDPASVNDLSEVRMVLQVPSNVTSISFDFNFMSAEYPFYLCMQYDDTFIAYLESNAFTGNVSFDENGNRVSINIGFFNVCATADGPNCEGNAELLGTGFEDAGRGGGTGWLTTTAPVVPGEKIALTFMVWDEGDHRYDSTVLLDNFRWGIQPIDAPTTVERVRPTDVEVTTTSASSAGTAR